MYDININVEQNLLLRKHSNGTYGMANKMCI